MKRNLAIWIDDMRNPFTPEWNPIIMKYIGDSEKEPTIAWLKSYEEFDSWMTVAMEDPVALFPALVCFDHDLGEEKTGLDCAKLLVDICMNNNMPLPEFECHSSNPGGRDNIISYLNTYLKSLNIN